MAARGAEVTGVRLIFANPNLGGGQSMMTLKKRPASVKGLVDFLCEWKGFAFEDICDIHGVNPRAVHAATNALLLTGFDGPRRVPIRGDEQLMNFFLDVRHTPLPSVEVQLTAARRGPRAIASDADMGKAWPTPPGTAGTGTTAPPSKPSSSQSARPSRGSAPRDRQEQLEDENFQLNATVARVERQLEELDRKISGSYEYADRVVRLAREHLEEAVRQAVHPVHKELALHKETDAGIQRSIDTIRSQVMKLTETEKEHNEELADRMQFVDDNMRDSLQDFMGHINDLRNRQSSLEQQESQQRRECQRLEKEINRLDVEKVSAAAWTDRIDEMQANIDQELQSLKERLSAAQAELGSRIENVKEDAAEKSNNLKQEFQKHASLADENIAKLHETVEEGLSKASGEISALEVMVIAKIDSQVSALKERVEKTCRETNQELINKDALTNRRVDELNGNTEATFKKQWEHIEEMVRVERSRLGMVEKVAAEASARIRSDLRSEIDRIRYVFEQDSSKITEDLTDLHSKHDIIKQEISFSQNRLLAQEDKTHRSFTETQTALRVLQSDAQEGLSSSQKMIHALRDDAVAFREKMAKYISLLQHTSDDHGDAIALMETHRGRLRLDLDSIMDSHKAYTMDMDDWANDVRLKVERLFRAMEPAKVEWCIYGAKQKLKELRRPTALRSERFALKGMHDAQLEFYPEGHNSSPEGKACLRVLFPPDSVVRYQCWLGKDTDGPNEYGRGDNGKDSLYMDLYFDSWKSQLRDDGCFIVVLEVLRDFRDDDTSLARQLRIESK